MAGVEEAGETGVTGARSSASSGVTPSGITPAGVSSGGEVEVTIRKCEALEEMRACFELQKEVWKFSDAELVPVRMFVVAAKIGGHVMGAFVPEYDPGNDRREELIGFALAIPAMRNGHPYLHSQMLAVR